MANIILNIGKDVEIAASDLLKWTVKGNATVQKATPGALAALGVLAGGVEKALADISAAEANPVAAIIGINSDIQDFKTVWPELKAFLATLGVKI